MFRPDLTMTRTSLDNGSLFAEQPSARYQTHSEAAFSTAATAVASGLEVRTPRTIGHKNTSQLSNYGASSLGYYNTTTSEHFNTPGGKPPVSTPRFTAASFKPTDVFGIAGRRDEPTVPTATYMMESTKSARRKPQPRYVHGGGHRNKSTVNVGKNVVNEYSPPPEFTTTHNALYQYNQQLTPRPRHQFDLPQKNISTFMSTNMNVAMPRSAPDDMRHGVGVRVGVREFTTRTDHAVASAHHYGGPAPRGAEHYVTSARSHFAEPSARLVVPPGKGGVDMTRSTGMHLVLPLGKAPQFPDQSTALASYRGTQPADGVRPPFPGRDTFGMQVARKYQVK